MIKSWCLVWIDESSNRFQHIRSNQITVTHKRSEYEPCNYTNPMACTSISMKHLISITWIMKILSAFSPFMMSPITVIVTKEKGKTHSWKLQKHLKWKGHKNIKEKIFVVATSLQHINIIQMIILKLPYEVWSW